MMNNCNLGGWVCGHVVKTEPSKDKKMMIEDFSVHTRVPKPRTRAIKS